MKKFALLTSVLALAACGGGSSSHGGGNDIIPDMMNNDQIVSGKENQSTSNNNNQTNPGSENPDVPVFNNVSVTSLEPIDHSVQINNYVNSHIEGTDFVNEITDTDAAVNALKLAYEISFGTKTNYTEKELELAYLLVVDNGEFNKETALNDIRTGAARYDFVDDILGFFAEDYTDIGINFSAIEDVSNVEFIVSIGNDENLMKFNMHDGNIVSITKNIDNPMELNLNRTGDKTFALAEKRYIYEIENTESIYNNLNGIVPNLDSVLHDFEYFALNEDLNADGLKQVLINRLIALAGNDEEKKELIITKVNEIDFNSIDFEKSSIDNAEVTMESVGNSANLHYADFGYMKNDVVFSEEGIQKSEKQYEVYSGGYGTKWVDTPNTSVEFNGKAVAAIKSKTIGNNPNEYMLAKTDHAKLALFGGVETLSMEFSKGDNGYKWYDITAVKNINTAPTVSTVNITYSDSVNSVVDSKFRLDENKTITNNNYFETDYYGDNNVATEATGFVQTKVDNLGITAAFGGTK